MPCQHSCQCKQCQHHREFGPAGSHCSRNAATAQHVFPKGRLVCGRNLVQGGERMWLACFRVQLGQRKGDGHLCRDLLCPLLGLPVHLHGKHACLSWKPCTPLSKDAIGADALQHYRQPSQSLKTEYFSRTVLGITQSLTWYESYFMNVSCGGCLPAYRLP